MTERPNNSAKNGNEQPVNNFKKKEKPQMTNLGHGGITTRTSINLGSEIYSVS